MSYLFSHLATDKENEDHDFVDDEWHQGEDGHPNPVDALWRIDFEDRIDARGEDDEEL